MPEAKKITKLEVINAYCFSLRMRTRKTEIENTGREETDAELDAAALARPVVRALVDAAERLAEWAEQLRACGDAGNWEWTTGDEYSETIAALAATKG